MDVDKERVQAMNDALEILEAYNDGEISIPRGKKPVVVFDIDDTLIDSRNGESILPMIALYRVIERMGIDIILITARQYIYGQETKEELKSHGLTSHKSLFLVGNGNEDAVQKDVRKARVRAALEGRGYSILMNLGDDPGDLLHGHYIYGIKLPYLYD